MGRNVGSVEVEFKGDKSQLNRDLDTLGRDLQRATGNMNKDVDGMKNRFGRQFGEMGKMLRKTGKNFQDFSDFAGKATRLTTEEIGKLPHHLKMVGVHTDSQAAHMKHFGETTRTSLDQITKSVEKTRVGFDKMTSMNKVGQSVTQTLNELRDSSKLAQLAAMGLNKEGVRIDPSKSKKLMMDFNKEVVATRMSLYKLRDSGDFLAFNEGMRQLDSEIDKVNRALRVTAEDGRGAYKVMQSLGVVTSDMANASALSMERFKDSVIRSNDMLLAKTTLSEKQMKAMDSQTFYGVSKQLLKLGRSMEQRAKEGSALNLALKRMGKDASMKEIMDEMMRIQSMASAMPTVMMGFGIATIFTTGALVALSNEIDGRLKPAAEEFKSTWTDALRPFISAFTTGMVKVIEFGTWIGSLAKRFAEVHPQLSQMAWGFLYLTMAIGTIAAPLGVAAGFMGSFSAVFSVLYTGIAAFVPAFLAAMGVAMVLAAVVVSVVAVIFNMWNASEKFRNSIANLWNSLIGVIQAAVAPIMTAWDNLKTKFQELLNEMTGGNAKSAGDFWQWLGDKTAVFVDFMSATVVPVLGAAFQVIGQVISTFIDIISFLVEIFTIAMPFIVPIVQETFQTIGDLITGVCDVITGIIEAFHALFTGDWDALWEAVKKITSGAWEAVWAYFKLFAGGKLLGLIGKFASGILGKVVGAFGKMKTNTVNKLKEMGDGVSKKFGDMKKWAVEKATNLADGVKNAYQTMKVKISEKVREAADTVVKKFSSLKTSAVDKVKSMAGSVGDWFLKMKTKMSEAIRNASQAVVDKFNSMKTSAIGKAKDILSGVGEKFASLRDKITSPIEKAKNTVLGIVEKIKGAFSGMKLSFPKISLPSISIGKSSRTIMGKEFSVPTFKINWNAKGGIYNGASLLGGGQGVGEAGAEAVLPIEHKRYMRPFASAISELLSEDGSSGGNAPATVVYQMNMPNAIIREEADIRRVVDELERRRKTAERSKGYRT